MGSRLSYSPEVTSTSFSCISSISVTMSSEKVEEDLTVKSVSSHRAERSDSVALPCVPPGTRKGSTFNFTPSATKKEAKAFKEKLLKKLKILKKEDENN